MTQYCDEIICNLTKNFSIWFTFFILLELIHINFSTKDNNNWKDFQLFLFKMNVFFIQTEIEHLTHVPVGVKLFCLLAL